MSNTASPTPPTSEPGNASPQQAAPAPAAVATSTASTPQPPQTVPASSPVATSVVDGGAPTTAPAGPVSASTAAAAAPAASPLPGTAVNPTASAQAEGSSQSKCSSPSPPKQSKAPGRKTYIAGTQTGELDEARFDDDDPTADLTDRAREAYPSLLSEFDPYADQLLAKGILVIASAHQNLASSAAILVSGASQLGGARPRRLMEWSQPLATILNRENRRTIGAIDGDGGGRNVVLLIHAHKTQHLEQTYDLLKDHLQQAFSKQDNFHVIVAIFDDAQRQLKLSRLGSGFPVWNIDSQRHLLLHYGHAPEEVDGLLAQLDALRMRIGWSGDDVDFMFWLEEQLRRKNLRAALLQPMVAAPPQITGEQLLDSASKLEKCVLFAAAMFPGTRMGEFEALVGALVKAEKVPVQALPGQEPLPPEDGWTYWQSHAQEIFQKLMLEIQREPGQPPVVEFRLPSLRKSLREAFFPPDMIRWLNRLHEDGLLVSLGRSRSITARLIELTGELAVEHGDVFDRHWLMSRYQTRTENEGEPQRAVRRRWHGQNNFLALCRTFLSHESTRIAITDFMEDLIRDTQPDCTEALEILVRLSSEEHFDAGKYYFHLLHSGHSLLRLRILRRLLGQMRDVQKNLAPGPGSAVIRLVAGWLPDAAAENLGAGHRWALAFLYSIWEDYRDWSLEQGALEHDVPVPWLEYSPDTPPLAERLAILKVWFSHPRLAAAVEELIRIIAFELHADALDTVHWELMRLFYSPRSVGEALVVEALSGFYLYSGNDCWLELADHLRTTLGLKARENFHALIRQQADIPLGDAARKSKAVFEHHKVHVRRAYQLAQRLFIESHNPAQAV